MSSAAMNGSPSATATRQSNGDGSTSELGGCLGVDSLFRNRFEIE